MVAQPMTLPPFRRETPIIVRCDRYEIRIYFQANEMCFHRLVIRHGEIVPEPTARFRLRYSDYAQQPDTVRAIKEFIGRWK